MDLFTWCVTVAEVLAVLALGGWLVVDHWREKEQRRLVDHLAQRYGVVSESVGKHRLFDPDDTWPIVAQQPVDYFDNAVTVPMLIARITAANETPTQSITAVELPTVVLPVVVGDQDARRAYDWRG